MRSLLFLSGRNIIGVSDFLTDETNREASGSFQVFVIQQLFEPRVSRSPDNERPCPVLGD